MALMSGRRTLLRDSVNRSGTVLRAATSGHGTLLYSAMIGWDTVPSDLVCALEFP